MLQTLDNDNVDKCLFNNSLNRQPRSLAAGPWEDLKDLCPSPVPRDNVSGFLLCFVGISSAQMSERLARTMQGGGGNRYGEKNRKHNTGFLVSSDLSVPLGMQGFRGLINPWTVNALYLWPWRDDDAVLTGTWNSFVRCLTQKGWQSHYLIALWCPGSNFRLGTKYN